MIIYALKVPEDHSLRWICHHAPFIVTHFKAHPPPWCMMGNLSYRRLDIVSARAIIKALLAFLGCDYFVSAT